MAYRRPQETFPLSFMRSIFVDGQCCIVLCRCSGQIVPLLYPANMFQQFQSGNKICFVLIGSNYCDKTNWLRIITKPRSIDSKQRSGLKSRNLQLPMTTIEREYWAFYIFIGNFKSQQLTIYICFVMRGRWASYHSYQEHLTSQLSHGSQSHSLLTRGLTSKYTLRF